jgi:hypothetical protein
MAPNSLERHQRKNRQEQEQEQEQEGRADDALK